MNMDDLTEIQNRIAALEAGLDEIKTLVQQAAAKRAQPAPPPPKAAPPPPPLFTPLRARKTPLAPPPPTPAQRAWQSPPSPPQPQTAVGPSPQPAAAAQPAPSSVPPPPPPARPVRSGEFEANLVGSWFARIGAFAIFLGAAFAFKYAVDRNLISPAGRIAIGVLLGAAFIGWGEWARRKTWPLFAQAVAGGGVAIMYLSVWAGYQLYDLMSSAAALVFLALVVVLGGGLAIRHNSIALAIMAALGGFLNPMLVSTGRGSPSALDLYLLFLNAGILGLAFYKQWRALTGLALGFTWMLLLGNLFDTTDSQKLAALAFGTVFYLLFQAALLARYRSDEAPIAPEDLLLTSLNSLVFFAFGMLTLPDGAQPLFALVLGLALIGLGAGRRRLRPADTNAVLTFIGLGVGSATTAVALQFEGPVLATVWALEAVLIMAASARAQLSRLRIAGLVVFSLSLLLSLFGSGLGALYDPPRLFFSVDALPFVTQVAALAGTSALLRRQAQSPVEHRAADTSAILALVLNLLWLTFEMAAQYQRASWGTQTLPFAIATFWAVYAAAIGAFGLTRGLPWTRHLAMAIFGLSLAISVLSSGLGAAYEPIRPVFSIEASAFLVQIAILASAAVALRRTSDSGPAGWAAVSANLLALMWITFELWAHFNRPSAGWNLATFTFTLSSAWTVYATGLLAFGIARRAKWARLFAVGLFGLVIVKLVTADVWLLETPLRIAALMGLGLVLLLASLSYHRFRALILGPDDPGTSAQPGAKAA